MTHKNISFFIPDDEYSARLAEEIKNELSAFASNIKENTGFLKDILSKKKKNQVDQTQITEKILDFAEKITNKFPEIKIIKACESSQADFLIAAHKDDIVIVDATIPDCLSPSSVYPLLIAQVNAFDHIVLFSRNSLPLNIVAKRQYVPLNHEVSDKDRVSQKIKDWLKQQLGELLYLIYSGEHYERVELDLNKTDDFFKLVSNMMEDALKYSEEKKNRMGKVLISYRSCHYEKVKAFKENLSAYIPKEYENKYQKEDIYFIPPEKLCEDSEALTPMRRWMLTGLLDDHIREAQELWIFGTKDYMESWWTLAELLLVTYFNQTSEAKKIQIKYIDITNGFAVREKIPMTIAELTDNQIERFARLLSNTRPETMGPEAMQNIEEKRRIAQHLIKLKKFKFMGLKVGALFYYFQLKIIEYNLSKVIPETIAEEKRRGMIEQMMKMYRTPEDLEEYFNSDIYGDDFWHTLSCQLTESCQLTKQFSSHSSETEFNITTEVIDEFLNLPMKECIDITEDEMIKCFQTIRQNGETILRKEFFNKATEIRMYYNCEMKNSHYLWFATRMGVRQGTNESGLKEFPRFIVKKAEKSN